MEKILYIHHGGELGGAPRSLSFLINDLDKTKYQPIVLMVADGPARKLFEAAGAEVIVDSRLSVFHGTKVSGMTFKLFLKNLLFLLPSYFYGKKQLRTIKPDLVHLNTTCLFIYAKAAKKINKKIPIITHVREPLLDSFFGKILKYMNHKYVDSYIAIEEYDLSKMNINGKYTNVIYNSVNFDVYNPSVQSNVLRQELKLSEKDIIILYLARIAESNGTLKFIEDIKNGTYPDNIHFAIIGFDPILNDAYVQKVKQAGTSNIHILEFRDDIPEVVASSDIMISPFTQPHFSRAVIEAAAMGIPSIVSNVKGLDELVVDEETGFIYNLQSSKDLEEKILLLSNDNELRKNMGEKAYNRATQLFDTKKNSKRVFDMYENILNKQNI